MDKFFTSGRLEAYAEAAIAVSALFGGFIWIGGIVSDVNGDGAAIARQARTIADLQASEQEQRLALRSLQTNMAVIEQRLCDQTKVVNLMHRYDLTTEAQLWQKSFGVPFIVDNAYFPPCDSNLPFVNQ